MQIRRPRRNRKSESIRSMVEETFLSPQHLVYPLFLLDGERQRVQIESMPDQYRFSPDAALLEIENCIKLGLNSFILFPAVSESLKDAKASYSFSKDSFYLKAISLFKKKFPEICIITDVAMDPYSSDGHDGIVQDGEILNDATLLVLAKMSLAQAKAGADIIAPSDMMDGRVKYIREELDQNGFGNTSIMSYTAKYASAFYGPFREALDSAPKEGDKKTYQMSPMNQREALIEAELDLEEGADFLMVKPALHYLDIIRLLKENFALPIAAYHVSGEYSMLKAGIQQGWLDEGAAIEETLYSIKRAGADIIITYLAKQYAGMLKKQGHGSI